MTRQAAGEAVTPIVPVGVDRLPRDAEPGERALLIDTLKDAVAALREGTVRFALTGGFAAHARGGALPEHDVDFLVHADDIDEALRSLAEHGFRVADTPEDWLVKAYDGDRMVDLIYRPVRRAVDDALLADSDEMQIGGVYMPVISATVLMAHKLRSFSPQYCDFVTALPLARLLREQIDWKRVIDDTQDSPYAAAFLFLTRRLGIIEVNVPLDPSEEA